MAGLMWPEWVVITLVMVMGTIGVVGGALSIVYMTEDAKVKWEYINASILLAFFVCMLAGAIVWGSIDTHLRDQKAQFAKRDQQTNYVQKCHQAHGVIKYDHCFKPHSEIKIGDGHG